MRGQNNGMSKYLKQSDKLSQHIPVFQSSQLESSDTKSVQDRTCRLKGIHSNKRRACKT